MATEFTGHLPHPSDCPAGDLTSTIPSLQMSRETKGMRMRSKLTGAVKLLTVGALAATTWFTATGVASAATLPTLPRGAVTWAQGDGDNVLEAGKNLTTAKRQLCGEWAEITAVKQFQRQDGGITMRQQIRCT
jgi:hypothetical protein